jgi:ABC-type uncharacterized transport system substrate-binding protein
MSIVFDIAARIATPLALAGILAVIIFFITLRILKKKKTPNYILKLIVKYLFGLAFVAMLLGFIGYIINISRVEPIPPHHQPDLNILNQNNSEKLRIILLLPDIAFAKTVREGFTNRLNEKFPQNKPDITDFYGPPNAERMDRVNSLWNERVQEIIRRNKYHPFDFLVTIGTQAAEKLKQGLGDEFGVQHFLFLAVSDPIRAGLVSSLRARSDSRHVTGVAYGPGIEDAISIINNIFPSKSLIYIYDPTPDRYNQDIAMAERLRSTELYRNNRVKIKEITHFPNLENLDEENSVYFSWYMLETMFETGAGQDLLRKKIIVASTEKNVEQPGLAAIAVAPDDTEVGSLGADIIIKNKIEGASFGTIDIKVPNNYYWINTETAKRYGIEFSHEILRNAKKLFNTL